MTELNKKPDQKCINDEESDKGYTKFEFSVNLDFNFIALMLVLGFLFWLRLK